MKRQIDIDVGLLYQAIMREGSLMKAAALWRTSSKAINQLLAGETPRLDALKRILAGSGIPADKLIRGPGGRKPANKKNGVVIFEQRRQKNGNQNL